MVVYPVILNPSFAILETNFITCKTKTTLYENILRTIIVIVTIVGGILSIGDFQKFMALAGSIICTPVSIMFPPLFHFKLYKGIQPAWRSFLDIAVLITGVVVALLILIFTLIPKSD